MATRVDLEIVTVRAALQLALNSEKRAEKSAKPQFAELHKSEIQKLQSAINTLTETK